MPSPARFLTVLLVFLSSSAAAQLSTPSSFLNTESAEPQLAVQTSSPLPDGPVSNATTPEAGKPLDDLSINVRAYRVEGADPAHADQFARLLQPYTGEGRTFEDLSNAAQRVTAYLQKEMGYYLAYAYLPAQDVKEGIITIRALPGVLESVEVVWPEDLPRVDREVILDHLERLRPGTAIQVSDVERVVFLLNDLRGIRMSFAIKPGTLPGQAILVATPTNESPVTGSIALDGNGSRFAGTYRGVVTLAFESPFGLGDSFSFSHLQSNTSGMDFTLLGYTLPVGSDGLKLGANISTVNYELDENDFPLGLNGEAKAVGVFALYPLIRSRNLNMFLLAGYDRKEFTDRQVLTGLKTVKNLDSFRVALSGDFRDSTVGGGLSFYNFGIEESKVHYPGGTPFGLDDELAAMRLSYSLGRLQTLLPGQLMWWGQVRGQHALDNLDSSDQCSLGGASGVRAFAQGEASGDSCDLLTAELRYMPSIQWLGVASRELS
ncbi:MAG TPA: ShlB/FhaC/HecB family hemolysin secretion/activation protein, partial [Limnobacter sp.]|nr:ShlB/FhaC/HecB family hemolysin secretion/activation protein [Limnobacter sp.]